MVGDITFRPHNETIDVGELIGTTTIEKAGLLSPDLFKVYPHFVNAYDSVYKIADNVTDWYRAPIAVLCNDSADTCMDFLSFIYTRYRFGGFLKKNFKKAASSKILHKRT